MTRCKKKINAYLFTRSLIYSSTNNTTLSSLRGTKQSSTGEFVGVFLLDCFAMLATTEAYMTMITTDLSLRGTKQSRNMIRWIASYLAMTNQREGRRDEKANGRKKNKVF
ncbi:MAG: hypothetical protein LBL58_18890 [Tannerellaceae bacterium]|nr:hypothetical protein [Tannerellaceae bacterium]